MADKYRIVHAYQRHYVVNRKTGNVVTKPIRVLRIAEEIKNSLEDGQLARCERLPSVDGGGLGREMRARPTRVYAVAGSSFQSWQAEMEDGDNESWEEWSSPHIIGVCSTSALALATGIRTIMDDLCDVEFDVDPETGEPWMPGMNPLDSFAWVDAGDRPYDESGPLSVPLWGEEFGWPKDEPRKDKAFQPHGSPAYTVYLREGTGDPKTEHYHACVVVHEIILDEQT